MIFSLFPYKNLRQVFSIQGFFVIYFILFQLNSFPLFAIFKYRESTDSMNFVLPGNFMIAKTRKY